MLHLIYVVLQGSKLSDAKDLYLVEVFFIEIKSFF